MPTFFRKIKLAIGGLLDRKFLYQTTDAVVSECACRLDAYYEKHNGHAENQYNTYDIYFKNYEFKDNRVQLRYIEDGEGLVEIAAYNRSHSCIYPPPEKWAEIRHSGHGQGYRISIYNHQLLQNIVKEVVEMSINYSREKEAKSKEILAHLTKQHTINQT
ncbi:hypothetical protein [Chlorobium ferrooxidans]|uniref:hypothetical protein n=1 Tax=Chlorobium ferrooxidans TaxID=84205 RepID=UPI00059111BC|nr:hypothetical protein [Chlorobium ferrooxidans]